MIKKEGLLSKVTGIFEERRGGAVGSRETFLGTRRWWLLSFLAFSLLQKVGIVRESLLLHT